MPSRRDRLLPRLFILAILTFGGLIFALPFLDMLSTSVKLDDETASEHYHLFPKIPHAQWQSPYVDTDFDNTIERPADMPAATWKDFEKPFTTTIRQSIAAWWDAQPYIKSLYPVDRETALNTLTQTVGHRILARLSDSARAAGIPAMLAESAQLANHETIFPEFKTCIPRFALGDVRVRLSDFSPRLVGGPENWSTYGSVATLTVTDAPLDKSAHATLNFHTSSDSAIFTLRATPPGIPMYGEPETDPDATTSVPAATTSATALQPLGHPDYPTAATIDRVYISYLPDRSWSKIDITITRNNIRYRMTEPLYSDDVRWNEIELRWPDPNHDSVAGRSYRILQPVLDDGRAHEIAGPAEPFTVQITLTPTSAPGALYAKATRNYVTAFQQVPIARYIATSLALAILNIILVLFASSLVAYTFARLEFPGRNLLFGVLLATMMIPAQVTMIPTFLIYKNLGWYNTLLPLWLPSAFGRPFFIFMARQFYKSIPRELEEAARIDGCGFFRIYWHIMLPLIRPTLAAIAMFSFQASWSNFMGPLIYINDERLFNLAFGLFKFQLVSGSSNSLMMAGAFIMTLPLIITFFLFQRYFIQGVSLSGLGGR